MKKTWVVTLGREFCSGGAEVAGKVAERLGIPYYDRALIDHAVEKTNLSRAEVTRSEETGKAFHAKGFMYSGLWYSEDPELVLPVHQRVYDAQCETIRELAGKGPCVIVGRCADFVLGECDKVVEMINVFIHADIKKRVNRAMRIYGIPETEAQKLITKTDRIRSRYYNAHTGRQWADPGNYDLVIDTGDTGTDAAADIIVAAVKAFLEYGRNGEL